MKTLLAVAFLLCAALTPTVAQQASARPAVHAAPAGDASGLTLRYLLYTAVGAGTEHGERYVRFAAPEGPTRWAVREEFDEGAMEESIVAVSPVADSGQVWLVPEITGLDEAGMCAEVLRGDGGDGVALLRRAAAVVPVPGWYPVMRVDSEGEVAAGAVCLPLRRGTLKVDFSTTRAAQLPAVRALLTNLGRAAVARWGAAPAASFSDSLATAVRD